MRDRGRKLEVRVGLDKVNLYGLIHIHTTIYTPGYVGKELKCIQANSTDC